MTIPQGFSKRPKWQPKTKLDVSSITGKWLVQLFLNGAWQTISAHRKEEDANAASQEIKEVFGRYSLNQLKNPKNYRKALSMLSYEDDDEVIGVICDGELKTDAETLRKFNDLPSNDVIDVEAGES